MSEEWRGMSDEQKVQYDQLAVGQKQRYEREKAEYQKKQAAAHGGASDKVVGKKRPAPVA
jgi:hypothetical protein